MKQIFIEFFRKNWGQVIIAQFAFAVATGMNSLVPIITRKLINANLNESWLWIGVAAVVGIVLWRLQATGNTKTDQLRNDMIFFGRMQMLEKLERCKHLPDRKTLLQYVQNDSTAILNGQVELIICSVAFVIDLVIGCGVVWYFLSLRYMLTLFVACLLVVGTILIFVVNYNKYNKTYDKITAEFKKALVGFGTLFQDYLLNNNAKFARDKIHDREKDVYQAFMKKRSMKNNVMGLSFALKSIIAVIIVFVIKITTDPAKFSAVDVLTLVSYFFYIYVPLQMILNMIEEKSQLDAIMKRVEEIMAREELSETDGATVLRGPIKTISFENVKYSVEKDGQTFTILNGISLDINRGEKIGLVGPSGMGKSTMTKALYRDIDISSGSIKINGRDVREYTRESLYSAFFIVPQESRALEGTIKENLQVANAQATDEEMIKALARAGLSSLNLDEVVEGDNARQLSGGERQRLAIARMYLRPEVQVIVLDEATSSLDEQTQHDVLQAIKKFQYEGNRIVISIAHRLSTIRNSDQICVLSDGKIIESGNHESLLAAGGAYAKLHYASEDLL